jgi:NADH-quinone oxidoreductase subunit C
MEAIEKIKETVLEAVPQAKIEIINSATAAAQPALLTDAENLYAVARFLKEDARLQMDFCSCVTGVDYLPRDDSPGFIEVVYHLYSVALKQGPVVLKVRVPRETEKCRAPSLTPLWRGCELQEREAYDLYGVVFEGHPDLRRILMWDEFTDFPMRKDYQPPPDYEWEPTPHDDTLEQAAQTGGVVPPTALEELRKQQDKSAKK